MTSELPKPTTFALSISENPDLGMLGLSMEHLREAMADFALHLLASGANLCANTDGRILLGGQVEGYKGRMPGIAEEALLSLQAGQPVFLVGGFGGCTRDIAETLGLVDPWCDSRPYWPEREAFGRWEAEDLLNGLSIEENRVLARTPYVDEALTLVLQGIQRLRNSGNQLTELDLARSRGGASRPT